jgi:hypothetical protein
MVAETPVTADSWQLQPEVEDFLVLPVLPPSSPYVEILIERNIRISVATPILTRRLFFFMLYLNLFTPEKERRGGLLIQLHGVSLIYINFYATGWLCSFFACF